LEVASGVLFVFAYHFAAPSLLQVILLGGALWILLLITIIDIQTQTIPDILNISFILCALLFSLSAGLFSVWPLLLGTGFLGSQWLLSHGRWIGSGDVFLIAGIALLLGTWKLILICLLLSYIFGGTVAAYILIMKKKTRKDAIAFGPFLAVGTMGTLLFGERILVAFF
jgi:leader peptidase (prepilin peptidase)/N-methyltransferase